MKKQKIVVIMLVLLFISCHKVEDELQSSMNNGNSGKSNTRVGKTDSTDYYMNMDLPTRDIFQYVKNGGTLPSTKLVVTGKSTVVSTQLATTPYPDYHCCNNICLTIPVDPYTFYAPFTDTWGNSIKFIGRYGTDPRQMYYVYTPPNTTVNSKIVVLIHGGGWNVGPDPNLVNGWGSTYAPGPLTGNTTNRQQNNIVKNLLSQGYVVVSVLYRLVQSANTTTDIVANPISINDQINDIDAAITHIRSNFPTCLWQTPLNANNIQLMGESAGGHLALLYSYTRANTSYIKSVVSVAGPTNMNQLADFVNNKLLINIALWSSLTCGTVSNPQDYVFGNYNDNNFTHLPFYGVYNPDDDATYLTNTGIMNSSNFTCRIKRIFSGTTTYPESDNLNKRRTDSYMHAQSLVKQIITNPLTNIAFTNISPCAQLNSSRIIPTFIVHGTKDRIVPYAQATNTMDTRLINTGGLIGTYYSGTNIPASNTYASTTNKHVIKLYTNADHNVSDFQNPQTNTGQSETQIDILTWLNGH
jgi:acetyl esterase/lipase